MKSTSGLLPWFLLFLTLAVVGILYEVSSDVSINPGFGISMQHGAGKQLGIIDNGDGIVGREYDNGTDIVTYFEGNRTGYRTFGDYGDVISYDEGSRRITHRALMYIRFNFTNQNETLLWANRTINNVTADIPELGLYGLNKINFTHVGWDERNVSVHFTWLWILMDGNYTDVEEGYITLGDNMPYVDQHVGFPVVGRSRILDMVVGVVDNELASIHPADYLIMVILLISLLGVYLLWVLEQLQTPVDMENGIGNKGDDPRDDRPPPSSLTTGPGYQLMIRYLLILLVGYMLVKVGIQLLFTASQRDIEPLPYIVTLILVMVIPSSIGPSIRHHYPSADRYLPAMACWALLVPGFFVFSLGSTTFSVTFMAMCFIMVLYNLRPDQVFSSIEAGESDALEQELGNWVLIMGPALVMFFFVILTTVRYSIFLLIGSTAVLLYILGLHIRWTVDPERTRAGT